MRKLVCWSKAIPLWLKTGIFASHCYESTAEDAIIIATEKSFRVANDYKHTPDETVYPHAVLERCKCMFCGHEELAWYTDRKEFMRMG